MEIEEEGWWRISVSWIEVRDLGEVRNFEKLGTMEDQGMGSPFPRSSFINLE